MSGNYENAECEVRNAELGSATTPTAAYAKTKSFRIPRYAFRTQSGFSLLELMISMFILIILISVAVPTYQRSVQHAKETVLKENLWQMRRAIDQYSADKAKLPQSVEDLVGYGPVRSCRVTQAGSVVEIACARSQLLGSFHHRSHQVTLTGVDHEKIHARIPGLMLQVLCEADKVPPYGL